MKFYFAPLEGVTGYIEMHMKSIVEKLISMLHRLWHKQAICVLHQES